MHSLGWSKRLNFYRKFIGKSLPILIETKRDGRHHLLKGISSNYLPVLIDAGDELKNGGTVRIRTRHHSPDNMVILEVEDSGYGVPIEQRKNLFAINDSNKPGGFGLGLKLSKDLVQLHNGTMEVDSSELGGALFRIAIPVEV